MDIEHFIKQLPKTELHLHLEGSVSATTARELAIKHGHWRPELEQGAGLYTFANLQEFLVVYAMVAKSMVDHDDFHRTTYECLKGCADSGARYVEFFFSPDAHREFGVPYRTMIDGIVAAMRDAETDFGLMSRLIPAHNRELGQQRGMEFLDMALGHRVEQVVGIGLDYDEAPHPPAAYAPMFQKAHQAGLFTSAHAGESGPAGFVRDCLDLLQVDRIDHGYNIVDDAALTARARRDGIFFTVCPSTTIYTTRWKDLASPEHAIKTMLDQGLQLTVNSDDPGFFSTTLTNEYVLLMGRMGLSPAQIKQCALNGVRAAWLDESVKRAWIASWTKQIDLLIAEFERVRAAENPPQSG